MVFFLFFFFCPVYVYDGGLLKTLYWHACLPVSEGNCVHEDWTKSREILSWLLPLLMVSDPYAAVILGDPAAICSWVKAALLAWSKTVLTFIGPAQTVYHSWSTLFWVGALRMWFALSFNGKGANALEDVCHSWDWCQSGLLRKRALTYITKNKGVRHWCGLVPTVLLVVLGTVVAGVG